MSEIQMQSSYKGVGGIALAIACSPCDCNLITAIDMPPWSAAVSVVAAASACCLVGFQSLSSAILSAAALLLVVVLLGAFLNRLFCRLILSLLRATAPAATTKPTSSESMPF